MKRYKIVHKTVYTFAAPVTLNAHALLLRPRDSHELRIESSILRIDPVATLRWVRDIEDNSIAIAEFSQPSDRLEIYSEVDIQQYNVAPMDFVVDSYAAKYPFTYSEENLVFLQPYLTVPAGSTAEQFEEWIKKLHGGAENLPTSEFLQHLLHSIHTGFDYRIREEEGVQTAEETLQLGTGSCRDFANLFILTARHCGIAARFVSGYLNTPSSGDVPGATHAWAEVYIPGAGWKGFDPTSDCIVGSDHIPVAVSHNPAAVPPVAGAYVGPPNAGLEVGVWVKDLDEPAAQ
jgi:transglutaminase-like putative cysteine protease